MIESTESPEDVEQSLANARRALQDFEDGVDTRRLLLRLRTASPAHPVLLARFLFAILTFLCVVAAVVVMLITVINNELARTLARFEQVIPVPEGIPALPAVLAVLGACMFFAWLMATLAALAIGRDAQMLPWEQKQHQKLVNEVTRLTTQKAVMERIRATPAGARPRIATPVPVMRGRQPSGSVLGGGFRRTPAPSSRAQPPPPAPTGYEPPPSEGTGAGGFGKASGGYTPQGTSSRGGSSPARPSGGFGSSHGGGFGRSKTKMSSGGGAAAAHAGGGPAQVARAEPAQYTAPPPQAEPPPAAHKPKNGSAGPAYSAPMGHDDVDLIQEEEEPTGQGIAGGVRLGSSPKPQDHQVDDFADLIEIAPSGHDTPDDGGILSKARANRATPFGSAGRVRPPPRAAAGPATRGGTPLGAAPKAGAGVGRQKPRLAPPLGFPGTPDRAGDRANVPSGIFGTPPPITRASAPPTPGAASYGGHLQELEVEEAFVMDEASDEAPKPAAPPVESAQRRTPTWGQVDDEWLRNALVRAENLVKSFPIQAYLEFSQEPNLPFTLVIARATPAMAVRAMVNYVEFMASIYTPPRGRIELVNVAHLDRSFHKNVQAALEPYFGENVEVEPNPGRVDIRFTDPDPGWGAWPMLPIQG